MRGGGGWDNTSAGNPCYSDHCGSFLASSIGSEDGTRRTEASVWGQVLELRLNFGDEAGHLFIHGGGIISVLKLMWLSL